MHRRKLFAALAVTWTAGALVVGACGFPDVAFTPADASLEGGSSGARTDGPPSNGTSSSGTVVVPPDATGDDDDDDEAGNPFDAGDGGGDASADADASDAADAADARDSGSPTDSGADTGVDAGPDAAACCDCDGDGYFDTTRTGCTTKPLPRDCDDSDPRTHPNQGFIDAAAAAPRNGDWDCSGTVDHAYQSGSWCTGTGLTGCTGGKGYQGTPACGAPGDLYTCVPQSLLALACNLQFNGENLQQLCK